MKPTFLMNIGEIFAKALPRLGWKMSVPKTSKHQASKRGAKHFHRPFARNGGKTTLTNNQRVVNARARRMGVDVSEYYRRYKNA